MDRNKGIGGTDIGAIIGVNPWIGPMDVYLDKLGITEPQADNEAMYWGREMEPVLAKRYLKETNEELFIPNADILPYRHPEYPWYLGSPDALVYPAEYREYCPTSKGGVDFKTTGRREGWGTPGTDEVPEWIHTQADWYMGLTGAEWWDIAVLFFSPRREFSIYRIPRNQELIDNLIEAGRDFWLNHVVPGIPPPIDASPASKKFLEYAFPRDVDDLFAATAEIERLAKLLQTMEVARDKAVEDLTVVQNLLKQDIGDHAGVISSIGKITWKKTKDRETVDWMAYNGILLQLLEREIGAKRYLELVEEIEDLLKRYTKTTPGSRVFRAWWRKSDE